MDNIKILSLGDPLLRTWASNSHLHAIISSIPNSNEWIINNFVQIFGFFFVRSGITYPPNFHYMSLHNPFSEYYPGNAWDLCPFIQKNSLDRGTLNRIFNSFVEFAIEMLNNENYVCLYLERVFNKSVLDPVHFSLIYGYDLDLKELYFADHSDQGKYGYYKMSFDAIENAYNSVEKVIQEGTVDPERALELEYVYFIKKRNANYEFNIELFKYDLKEYLYSVDNSGFLGKRARFFNCYNNYAFGINTYSLLIDHLESLITGNHFTDWRTFTFLKDHKELMLLRLQYMYDHKYLHSNDILKQWKIITDSFAVLLNLYLKYIVSNDGTIISRIVSKIKELYKTEREILANVLMMIDKKTDINI
jgi:hypothetical protein